MKDTVVAGSLRATDTLYSTTAQFSILRAPTSSNGTTFGSGTANNLLKSNGTSVYWTTLAASDIPNLSTDKLTSGTLGVARGGTGQTSVANIQAGKDGDGNTISSTYLKLSGGTLTGNLIAKKITIEHASGGQQEYRVTYGSTVDMSLMVGTANENHGIYDSKASKWMIYADASGNVTVNGNATNVTGTVAVANGGTGATTAANARTNLGARADTSPDNGAWFKGTPYIRDDGVIEIGKYIDFHASNTGTNDYDVRITAATTGLTISGTTSGTFAGNLTGNVTGNVSGTSANVTGTVAIANGGTGATTAANARNNLDITPENIGAVTKTTYEYNKEITFGSSGKLCIGKFPCYDSNVTIEIKATTSTTYYAVAILATQNINTSGGGLFTWNTYGDTSNSVTPNLYGKYINGSRYIEIYFAPTTYSKNLIHIQCVGLSGTPTNICESISSIPSDATRTPINTAINASNLITGTLTVEHGGTGATTAANARTNLGLGTMATETATNYLKLSGGTMTGLITAYSGVTHSGIKIGNTYLTAISGEIIFQNNGAIRFGTDAWDYDKWAGLKFDATNKIIYLGIADKSIFTGNNVLNNGTLSLINTRYFKMYGKDVFNINTAIDNTAFTSVLSLFHNENNESTVSNFDTTKSSWGITFERQWNSGSICSKAAGIFAYGISSWRTGLVFRTKTGTANTGTHDTTALYLNHDGSATFANTVNATTFVGALTGNATSATVASSANAVAWANVTGKPNRAGSDSDGGPAQTVKGAYTLNGGQQNPNYFGTNKVGFLMMNTPVNNNSHYKDWIIMDCYSDNDVGGGVAFGVNRQALGAYIMRSASARTSWAESAELIGTHNYTTYTVTKTGSGASGTWGINITGSAADVTGVVSVAHGGTGASSAGATALSNLGLQYSQISITFNSLGYALYTFEGNTLVVGYNVVGDTAEIDMYRGQGYTGYIFTDRAYRHFKDGLYPASASIKTGGTYLIDIYYMAYV